MLQWTNSPNEKTSNNDFCFYFQFGCFLSNCSYLIFEYHPNALVVDIVWHSSVYFTQIYIVFRRLSIEWSFFVFYYSDFERNVNAWTLLIKLMVNWKRNRTMCESQDSFIVWICNSLFAYKIYPQSYIYRCMMCSIVFPIWMLWTYTIHRYAFLSVFFIFISLSTFSFHSSHCVCLRIRLRLW